MSFSQGQRKKSGKIQRYAANDDRASCDHQ
jgi:hypothetical protein